VTDNRGHQSTVTRFQLLAIFLLIVFAFGVVAVRTEVQQRQLTKVVHKADRNATLLAQAVYTQCTTQDASNARQAARIDIEIAAERRRPRPDPKRIEGLEKFRPNRLDCGRKP